MGLRTYFENQRTVHCSKGSEQLLHAIKYVRLLDLVLGQSGYPQ